MVAQSYWHVLDNGAYGNKFDPYQSVADIYTTDHGRAEFIGVATNLLTAGCMRGVGDLTLAYAIERTVTVMVITCPHALGLAVPLVVAVSTSLAAKHGLLIRDRTAFENARQIQSIVFDKTGTLTHGRFGVSDVLVFRDEFDENTLIELAAAVEQRSQHPIAKGIVDAAKGTIPSVEEFQSLTGRGAQAKVRGREVKIVSPGYLKEIGVDIKDERLAGYEADGKTVVYVLIDHQLAGALALADVIRNESSQAVRELQQIGVKTIMLTGDNRRVAQWVADKIGLDDFMAEVLPGDKAAKIRAIQEQGLTVAMTGDGVNDAPALAQADLGIAIGAGTDVAVQTADVILVNSNPLDTVSIIALSKATYAKMIQNLLWATGYNALAIPLAAGVLYPLGIVLSPAVGAVLMSLSTVVVAFNARLLNLKRAL